MTDHRVCEYANGRSRIWGSIDQFRLKASRYAKEIAKISECLELRDVFALLFVISSCIARRPVYYRKGILVGHERVTSIPKY